MCPDPKTAQNGSETGVSVAFRAGGALFAAPDPVPAAAFGEGAKTAAAGDLSELREGLGAT